METAEVLKGEKNPLRKYVITMGLSSGSKDVMFVLYSVLREEFLKERGSKYVDPYTYLGSLSNNFETACVNARKKVGKFEIEVNDDESFGERRKSLTIPFGKYIGKTIEEVFDTDPKYIFWMSQKARVKSRIFMNKLADYGILSKELIIEENKEKTNPFLPFDTEKITRSLQIYSVKEGEWGLITRFTDSNGNRFQYSGKEIGDKGDTIEFTGKVKKNFSSMGLNFNILNLR